MTSNATYTRAWPAETERQGDKRARWSAAHGQRHRHSLLLDAGLRRTPGDASARCPARHKRGQASEKAAARACSSMPAASSKRPRTDVAQIVHRHAAHIHADGVALPSPWPECLLLPAQRVVQKQLAPRRRGGRRRWRRRRRRTARIGGRRTCWLLLLRCRAGDEPAGLLPLLLGLLLLLSLPGRQGCQACRRLQQEGDDGRAGSAGENVRVERRQAAAAPHPRSGRPASVPCTPPTCCCVARRAQAAAALAPWPPSRRHCQPRHAETAGCSPSC